MRKILWLLIVVILLFAVSCQTSEEKNLSDFINEVFNRPSAAIEQLLLSTDLDKGMSTYFSSLSKYCTEKGLQNLIANRIPTNFDKILYERKLTSKVGNLKITKISDKAFEFETLLKISGDLSKTIPLSGQIIIEDGKVDYLHIYSKTYITDLEK